MTTGPAGSADGDVTTTAYDTPPPPPDDRPSRPGYRAGAATLGSRSGSYRTPIPGDLDDEPDYDEPSEARLPASQAASYGSSTVADRSTGRRGSSAVHPVSGATLRAWLTIGLTVAVVVMVFMGVILRLPPGDFSQYIAPLTGIAGLALGYWFGSDRSR